MISLKTWSKILLTALVMVLCASDSGIAAEQRSPLWGGSGGTKSFNLDCGSGGVIVGLTGKWGSWVDQLGVMCQQIKSDGTLGNYFTRGPTGGTGGTTSATRRCDSGDVVGGFFAHTGAFVDWLGIDCFKWNPSRKSREGSATKHRAIGNRWSIGASNNDFRCAGGNYVGKALRGRSGIYVDRVQVVCDEWNK